MLPSIARPTRGSMTTATIRDSMITTMPRRPRRLSEDLPFINPCPVHVTSPRKIRRTEVSLSKVGYLASCQGDHTAEAGRARRGVRQVVRGCDIPTCAYDAGGGSSERTCKQAGVADHDALNKHVLVEVRTTGALRRIDVFHGGEHKHPVAAVSGDVQSGRKHYQEVLVPGLREVQPRAVHASRIAADLLHL